MSWDLARKLAERFPGVEVFPREGEAPKAAAKERPAAPPAPAAPAAGPADDRPAAPGPRAAPSAPAPPPGPAAPTAPPGPEASGEAPAAAPAPAEKPAAPATRLPPKKEEPKAPILMTPGAWLPRERLVESLRFVATDPEFGMDYLSFVSGVDRPDAGQMEVVYHLFSMSARHELLLKVRVDRSDPRVDSVTSIWRGADWHEREAYDLLGIVFEGHPNLRRIMMTEDWSGHPLRKDYVYEDPQWLIDGAKQRQQEIQGFGLGERA